MVNKRLQKLSEIKKEIIHPELVGEKEYKILVIGWGSTYNIIKEAIATNGRNDISFLHFKQVFPLYSKTIDYLNRAEKVIIVENNATSQFAQLIRQKTGFHIKNKILQYDGFPFSVETIIKEINKIGGIQ